VQTNNLQPTPLVLLGRGNIFPRLGKVCLRQWEMSNVIFLQEMDRSLAAAGSLSLSVTHTAVHVVRFLGVRIKIFKFVL
jgi:hypothetical protein